MAMGGRPKEEGGHKRLNITLCASIIEFSQNVGNKSKFIEETIRKVYDRKPRSRSKGAFQFIIGIPELEQAEEGEASENK